jgi:hypothetical protein
MLRIENFHRILLFHFFNFRNFFVFTLQFDRQILLNAYTSDEHFRVFSRLLSTLTFYVCEVDGVWLCVQFHE